MLVEYLVNLFSEFGCSSIGWMTNVSDLKALLCKQVSCCVAHRYNRVDFRKQFSKPIKNMTMICDFLSRRFSIA